VNIYKTIEFNRYRPALAASLSFLNRYNQDGLSGQKTNISQWSTPVTTGNAVRYIMKVINSLQKYNNSTKQNIQFDLPEFLAERNISAEKDLI